jgi:membrane AbrB-like protein
VTAFGGYFVALGFAALGIGALSAAVLERVAGVDHATAFFGSMPGGAAEMAMMGERHGALTDRVAFAHSMRMLLVVTLVPERDHLRGLLGHGGLSPGRRALRRRRSRRRSSCSQPWAGSVARKLRVPTAFMMGPLVVTIALTVSEVSLSSVPTILPNMAQVILGCVLGSKFEPGFLRAAPRFVAALVPSVAITLGLAALVGWAISRLSGAYLGTSLLAAAPGGIAEMAITAKVLRIGVAFVTAAHIIRYAIVVIFSVVAFRPARAPQAALKYSIRSTVRTTAPRSPVKTSAVTPADLSASVLAVPPLARRADLSLAPDANRALIRHLERAASRRSCTAGTRTSTTCPFPSTPRRSTFLEEAAGPRQPG